MNEGGAPSTRETTGQIVGVTPSSNPSDESMNIDHSQNAGNEDPSRLESAYLATPMDSFFSDEDVGSISLPSISGLGAQPITAHPGGWDKNSFYGESSFLPDASTSPQLRNEGDTSLRGILILCFL